MAQYSLAKEENRKAYADGLKAGVPIGLGYFAVAFSLGILVAKSGVGPLGGAVASFLCMASAGEFAGFTVIMALGTYLEMVLISLVANIRYVLMSCALSQRVSPELPLVHRFFMGMYVTDEIFAVSISRPGYLNPVFTYGAATVSGPLWSLGTALGCVAGQLMPLRAVSAFSVALYGMFLAVIMPPARKSRVIFGLVAASFILSYICSVIPIVKDIPSGVRIATLTVIICSAAAILFPRDEEVSDEP